MKILNSFRYVYPDKTDAYSWWSYMRNAREKNIGWRIDYFIMTVYLDNENHPEVQIKLYRYDGSHCLAVVDGAPVSLVTRTSAVDLIEAVHAIVLD